MNKVIILGSGCAGSTAAIYAARANLKPLVLEGHEPGGQLSLTTLVENYPGFPEGIEGPELVQNMKSQAQRFGAEYRQETVISADLSHPFTIFTDQDRHQTLCLIIASGASAQLLGLESEKQLIGHGVSTCATCDGFFFKEQRVAVVGGGDTAVEEALFLTKFAKSVTIIHRRDQLRASKIMSSRALKHPQIRVLWDTIVIDVLDPEKKQVEAARLRNVKTGEESLMPLEGLFVAIGHTPNTKAFRGKVRTDGGYISIQGGSRTSVEGVFAAGDVHDHVYRQAVTAAGAGCRAAIDAERFLDELEHSKEQSSSI